MTQTEARGLPPLADYISCLPQEAALAAAHRGTAKNTKYPENSVSALNRLIEEGYLVTEIDVAGLKDGVHILYHDGVWDDKSTGRGPIASSTWADAGKILLNDTNGKPSSERPVKFEDYLLSAKGKIYLEIDFKSSSKYERVIKLIRKHKLADQVILISYSQGQTRKLSRLAPDMMISISPDEALGQRQFKPGQVAAWVGYNLDDKNLIQNLRDKNIPVLGRIRKKWNIRSADAADILVTDNIFDMSPVIGLTKNNRSELENCLEKL
jgi:glycerophosphoryl diester phosphodiesterase